MRQLDGYTNGATAQDTCTYVGYVHKILRSCEQSGVYNSTLVNWLVIQLSSDKT